MKKIILLMILALLTNKVFYAQEDKYLWLEEIDDDKALEFVDNENKKTVARLTATPFYQDIYTKSLDIFNATDRIAYPTTYGDYIYNFWKDKDHVRGIWRRTPKAEYVNGNPKWETILDIDALSKKDGKKWVYKGVSGLYPNYDRFLVRLSDGGGDAVIIKEFDVTKKQFIEDGFYIPESKGGASYVDLNTLLISSDFGEGTMTPSGYPNQVKLWKRDTPIENAKLIHEGDIQDTGSFGSIYRDNDKEYIVVYRAKTFYTQEMKVWHENKFVSLDIPEDASLSGILNDQAILDLKSDWTINGKTYKQGAIISLNFSDLIQGKHNVHFIYQPDEKSSVYGISATKNTLLLNILKDVACELFIYKFDGKSWNNEKVKAPELGRLSVVATDQNTDDYFFQFENFLTPETVYYGNAQSNSFKPFKSLPSYFDSDKFQVQQFKVNSKDGTAIPYFVVSPKNITYNGKNPTLISAYGGFESSSLPFYSGSYGASLLENGVVFVVANIRGGGEYGPKWHQAGLKEKRQNVYDDFHAVAEDLIARKITAPKHLGIRGGSNGGLLVGVAFTQRPDLYNAVLCQVPLLDMKRYNKLLAGASWVGEYGNPDIPEEWAYIKKYSPYHNLKPNTKYPEVFFYTSTRDDRVHPGHARKMAAKMKDMGYSIFYYENTEGGHAGSSTNEQRAKSTALSFSYLLMKLK
ncbi:prolyl oligopeptidase family serine peptidase [Aquimarina sp. D1M17]|uniref:prolyl oligopeptidase family serine peptidase n=1 Tax=Aquimarina acroporae TaxID=2937283 RepID=UPI0020BEF3FD|nr:prolyl oligopeptidase family serine peptidase [Aquimarina acroporae]MCK8523099.1 prolyl oligopeptidase family serine peptidase [Aquimarina acroporae]